MQIQVSPQDPPQRLDLFLHERSSDLSRTRVQALIKRGAVRVNGQTVRPSYQVQPGDRIELEVPEPEPLEVTPEDIPLDIRYEDADLLVVDKAAGMTVHPAPGSWTGTLVNALLHHCSDLSGINGVLRPGIVHRLDKETTGLLVVAKSDVAHRHLAAQLEARRITRRYTALVWGDLSEENGTVDAPIARHPHDRKKMGIVANGRRAVTHYAVVERFPFLNLLDLKLETGRTHQIRVHMQHLHHPIFGDPTYGGRNRTYGIRPEYRRAAEQLLALIARQALHARQLTFLHPRTDAELTFTAGLPGDMAAVLASARS